MSKLTKQIKSCGIHDCKHECFAISESEARKAIEVMREAFIEAVSDENTGLTIHGRDKAIKAIKSVK